MSYFVIFLLNNVFANCLGLSIKQKWCPEKKVIGVEKSVYSLAKFFFYIKYFLFFFVSGDVTSSAKTFLDTLALIGEKKVRISHFCVC